MGIISGFKAWMGIGEKAGDVVDTGLSVIEMGARGIDVLFHTEEEKSQEAIQARKDWMAHAITVNSALQNSNTESSKARRKFAGWILKNVLAVFDWCVICISIAHLSGKEVLISSVRSMVKDIKTVTELFYIGEAMVAVVGCFFLYYGAKKAFGK
jgi:hypothetical protein